MADMKFEMHEIIGKLFFYGVNYPKKKTAALNRGI